MKKNINSVLSEASEFIKQLVADKIEQQKIDAITSTEGPLLVIAGPGSGKTKTLVERIVYLILNGTPAENIMVATFTEKASKELITRVSNRLLELDLKNIESTPHLKEIIDYLTSLTKNILYLET
jgi:superfamily I DNA/RNA helicase